MKRQILAAVFLCAGMAAVTVQASQARWVADETGLGVDGAIRVMTASPDTQVLYAGGAFTSIGGVPVSNIARFDGQTWSPLADGLNGTVWALAFIDLGSGPSLYAGGDFTMSGSTSLAHVARWDGSEWHAVGTGTNGGVYALAQHSISGQPALIAAGWFTQAGGNPAINVARYSADTWSAMGSGLTSGVGVSLVRALAVYDAGSGPELYAAGLFTSPPRNIARWNGSGWVALGTGASGAVNALTVWNDGNGASLYVGGAFTSAGNVADTARVARWNGSAWAALDEGLRDQPVNALVPFDDGSGPALYAAGQFTLAGGLSVRRIARWRTGQWSALADGLPDDECWCDPACGCEPQAAAVYALAVYRDTLYVAGDFAKISECVVPIELARWMRRPADTASPDLNWDRHVDAGDLERLHACMTGPAMGPIAPCCEPADLNADGHVDLVDFAIFQRCLTIGSAGPPAPGCDQ